MQFCSTNAQNITLQIVLNISYNGAWGCPLSSPRHFLWGNADNAMQLMPFSIYRFWWVALLTCWQVLSEVGGNIALLWQNFKFVSSARCVLQAGYKPQMNFSQLILHASLWVGDSPTRLSWCASLRCKTSQAFFLPTTAIPLKGW